MAVEKNNVKRLVFRELNSSSINRITTEVLKPLEVIASNERQDLSKLLTLLNIEFNFNKTFFNNYYLLFLSDEKIIGYVIVSQIIQGKEARIKFHFLENDIEEKEIRECLKETIDQVFDLFHLQRVIFHIDKNIAYKQPEALISSIYTSFPVGLLHAEKDTCEFVIIKNHANHKAFYSL